MDKSSHKCIGNQSNQRTSIYRHIKLKCPKKPHQQSSRKTEGMKVNTIMKKLEHSDGKENGSNTNINHFAPIFESEDEEGT